MLLSLTAKPNLLNRIRVHSFSSSLSTSSSFRPLPLSKSNSFSITHSLPPFRSFMSSTYKYVVVGAGNAAGYAAKQFVANGISPNQVCIIGDEPHAPYERPALSKAVLVNPKVRLPGFNTCVGGGGERQLDSWYEQHGIDLKLSSSVKSIDTDTKTIVCGNQESVIASDAIIVATGASPIKLTRTPGHDLKGVYYLRNNQDAMSLFEALQNASEQHKNVAIIGGGYIGMEVGAAAITVGGCHQVSMIFPESHMMSRLFTPQIAQSYEDMYTAKGVTFVKNGALAKAFVPNNDDPSCVGGVVVARDGKIDETIPADVVVVGVGAKPESNLLKDQVNMDARGGVIVNEHLETSKSGIYAIGDMATFPLKMYNGKQSRMEHVQNCRDMATHVVNVIMKNDLSPYDYLPYFYSRVFHLSWQFFGDSQGECVVVGSMDGKQLAQWTPEQGTHPQLLAVWIDMNNNTTVQGVFMESPTADDTANMKKIARERPSIDVEALKGCDSVEEGWKILL